MPGRTARRRGRRRLASQLRFVEGDPGLRERVVRRVFDIASLAGIWIVGALIHGHLSALTVAATVAGRRGCRDPERLLRHPGPGLCRRCAVGARLGRRSHSAADRSRQAHLRRPVPDERGHQQSVGAGDTAPLISSARSPSITSVRCSASAQRSRHACRRRRSDQGCGEGTKRLLSVPLPLHLSTPGTCRPPGAQLVVLPRPARAQPARNPHRPMRPLS